MRSKALTWTLAGIVALATLALAIELAGRGDPSEADAPAAVQTSVTEAPPLESTPVSSTSSPPPATTTSSTTVPPAPTTTTAPPPPTTTTSAAPPTSAPSGYTPVPKPGAGLATVAPGGALTKHLAADIAAAFGLETAAVEAAIADVELPPEAGGNPEGWFAPGRYELGEGASASEIVQAMVDRRMAQLEERNIPRDQWYRVLTAASVIEKETYNQNEKPRVARVLNNRLAGGGPLQMDSIILYPVPEDRIFTTTEERTADAPYNSYRKNGLPPTPICAPDEASIDAFLAPPPGNWWFYVTINLDSGETRFAITYEEHENNVELLRAWLEENPTP